VKEPIIKVEGLSYQYATAEKKALKEISFQIYPGEYVAIMGPSEAGKTTLCLSLNGIIPHMMMGEKEGRVLVEGRDTEETEVREMAKTVGMVFDNPEYQLTQLTVLDEVAMGLENLGIPYEEMFPRIEEALEIVDLKGLPGIYDRAPSQLSGGQQQRLAIAAALAMYPKILVLDEPTSNLDPIGKQEVFSVLRRLNQEKGMTIIIAEHEVEVIAEYADRLVILNEGNLITTGSPEKVFNEVEVLKEIGLRSPQITEFGYRLRKKGRKIEGELPIKFKEALEKYKDQGVMS
jgi:energy-coupling factor transport system ATP-binding protein